MLAISMLEESYNKSNMSSIKEINDDITNRSIYIDLSILQINNTTTESINTENSDASWYELLWNNLSIPSEKDEEISIMEVRENLLKKYFTIATE
jgi:hypothetical protein